MVQMERVFGQGLGQSYNRSDLKPRPVDNHSEIARKLLSKGKHRNGGELTTHSANGDELTKRTTEKKQKFVS